MAKKIFYNKSRKVPKSLQIYILWLFFVIIVLPISIFFTSTDLTDIPLTASKIHIDEKTKISNGIFKNQNIKNEVVSQLKKFIPYFYWTKKSFSYTQKIEDQNCKVTEYVLKKKSQNKNLSFIFDLQKIKNHKEILKTILYLSETLQKVNLNYNINFHLINNTHSCQKYLSQKSLTGIFFTNNGQNNKNPFIINFINGKTLSIFWKKILQKQSPSFIEQIYISAAPSPFIREVETIFYDEQILIKTDFFNSKDNFKLILKTIEELNTVDISTLQKESFWFNNSSLGKTTYTIYIVLLFLTMFFPIINRLAQKKRFDFVAAIVSAIYFSLPAFALLFLMKIADWFAIQSIWYNYFMIIFFIILVLLFRKIEQKKFDFSVNIISSLLIVDILFFFLIFYNSALLIIFFLVIIFYSKIKYSHIVFSWLFFILGSIPLLLFMNYFMFENPSFDWNNSLEIYRQVELSNLIFYAFFIGSLLSLIQKNEEKL